MNDARLSFYKADKNFPEETILMSTIENLRFKPATKTKKCRLKFEAKRENRHWIEPITCRLTFKSEKERQDFCVNLVEVWSRMRNKVWYISANGCGPESEKTDSDLAPMMVKGYEPDFYITDLSLDWRCQGEIKNGPIKMEKIHERDPLFKLAHLIAGSKIHADESFAVHKEIEREIKGRDAQQIHQEKLRKISQNFENKKQKEVAQNEKDKITRKEMMKEYGENKLRKAKIQHEIDSLRYMMENGDP